MSWPVMTGYAVFLRTMQSYIRIISKAVKLMMSQILLFNRICNQPLYMGRNELCTCFLWNTKSRMEVAIENNHFFVNDSIWDLENIISNSRQHLVLKTVQI